MNMRAVFSGVVAGYDLTSLNKFVSILGLPKLPDSFDSVYVAANVLLANPSGDIPVKFDGTYQTRGYSSKVGVVSRKSKIKKKQNQIPFLY